MTGGRVTSARQPLLPLAILDGGGEWQTLPFVLDTGFTGFIAVPERYSRQLGLTFRRLVDVSSATEQSVMVASGHALIIWFGRRRAVRAIQAGTHPLIGMSLLWHHRIAINAITNGAVTMTPHGGPI